MFDVFERAKKGKRRVHFIKHQKSVFGLDFKYAFFFIHLISDFKRFLCCSFFALVTVFFRFGTGLFFK